MTTNRTPLLQNSFAILFLLATVRFLLHCLNIEYPPLTPAIGRVGMELFRNLGRNTRI